MGINLHTAFPPKTASHEVIAASKYVSNMVGNKFTLGLRILSRNETLRNSNTQLIDINTINIIKADFRGKFNKLF